MSIFLSVSNYLSLAFSLSFLSLSLIVYGSANTTVVVMNGTSIFPGVAQSILRHTECLSPLVFSRGWNFKEVGYNASEGMGLVAR